MVVCRILYDILWAFRFPQPQGREWLVFPATPMFIQPTGVQTHNNHPDTNGGRLPCQTSYDERILWQIRTCYKGCVISGTFSLLNFSKVPPNEIRRICRIQYILSDYPPEFGERRNANTSILISHKQNQSIIFILNVRQHWQRLQQ
jgi:hypothetical protein